MTATLALLVKVIVSSIRIFQKVVLQGNQAERIVKLIRAWKCHPVEHYFRHLQCHQRYQVQTKKKIDFIPEPTVLRAVSGVSPGRGLLIVHKRSSKSLFMGDGDEIFFGRS